ncbi:MAG: acylneuraminate cytidylyltransferase family protein [Anaerolineae bacterium]|nr:acylneuraminate cytidylyltransferase family protein [Anaerolineae bacterium]NUQ07145.1 acylneuraminate cytidylyltransferase family protein [Anaerolineae bacterium]
MILPEVTKRIALIPARGGSKRILHKNIRPFFGHPLIAYAISAAHNSQLFDHVVVSTDDAQIAQIAQWYGAEVLSREASLANDTATVSDVAVHVVLQLRASGINVTSICSLMPICPLRTSADIRQHFERFRSNQRLFQISVVPYRGVYPHWALNILPDHTGHFIYGTDTKLPSQMLQEAMCPTGAIWLAQADALLESRTFYGQPHHFEPIDANRGLDIDELSDWDLAELLVYGLQQRDQASPLEPIGKPPYVESDSE